MVEYPSSHYGTQQLIEEELTQIDSQLSDVNTKLSNIDTELSDSNTNITSVETELTDVNTKLSDVKTDLDTVNTNLSNIETKLETVNTNLSNIEDNLTYMVQDSATGTLGYTASFTDYSYIVEPTVTVTNNSDPVDINVNGVTVGQLGSGGDVATVTHTVADGDLTLSSASNFDLEIVSEVRK